MLGTASHQSPVERRILRCAIQQARESQLAASPQRRRRRMTDHRHIAGGADALREIEDG
ncbi:MAG: hypothetical protein AB7O55_22190 [Lautropia sp.]